MKLDNLPSTVLSKTSKSEPGNVQGNMCFPMQMITQWVELKYIPKQTHRHIHTYTYKNSLSLMVHNAPTDSSDAAGQCGGPLTF